MAVPKIHVNNNWLLLGAALLLGAGAVYLSNALLRQRMAELEQAAHRGEEPVAVVVAKHDLAAGDTISPADMAIRKIPRAYVHATAVLPSQFADVEHQRLIAPLRGGEALLMPMVEGNGDNVFSDTLKKGMRALTFEVDAVNSISGMLRPGDHIDLIYTPNGAGSGPSSTVPLLSDVVVLACDQVRTKRDERTGAERTFSTITLEVSPLDADRIIVAKSAGELTALLRHPEDVAGNTTRPLTPATLLGAAHGGGRAGDTVEFIVGGEGDGLADTQLAHLLSSPRAQAAVAALH